MYEIFGNKKFFWLIGFGIIVLYFLTRIANILSLPIFTDEAIYIRWAQIAMRDPAWRFISLTDGKQPLYVWIAMILLRFIHDPLLAGRSVSIIAGFFSTIGIFFLANEIFNNKTAGLLASLLYIVFPFALVYDRLALYEPLVSLFIIWSFYFEVLLVRHIRLDLGLILGMIVGGGMLTKESADFALAFLPVSLLLFNFKTKKWKENLFHWVLYAIAAVTIAELMYAILRLSPFNYIIAQKTATFVYPFKEWLRHPFTYLFSNLSGMTSWFVGYVTAPFILLILTSFLVSSQFFKEKALLLIAFLAPFGYLAFFGRTIYPRFILFMTMPLLVLAAYSLYELLKLAPKLYWRIAVFVVFFGMFVMTDFFIITDFAQAAIPHTDKAMLLYGWPSGVGVNETIAFLTEKARTQKIYVGTEGTFGLMPFALQIYLDTNPNVVINGFWPIENTPPAEAMAVSKKMPVYFVFYQDCKACKGVGIAPDGWPVIQVFQIPRIEKNSYYTLYQLQP